MAQSFFFFPFFVRLLINPCASWKVFFSSNPTISEVQLWMKMLMLGTSCWQSCSRWLGLLLDEGRCLDVEKDGFWGEKMKWKHKKIRWIYRLVHMRQILIVSLHLLTSDLYGLFHVRGSEVANSSSIRMTRILKHLMPLATWLGTADGPEIQQDMCAGRWDSRLERRLLIPIYGSKVRGFSTKVMAALATLKFFWYTQEWMMVKNLAMMTWLPGCDQLGLVPGRILGLVW